MDFWINHKLISKGASVLFLREKEKE